MADAAADTWLHPRAVSPRARREPGKANGPGSAEGSPGTLLTLIWEKFRQYGAIILQAIFGSCILSTTQKVGAGQPLLSAATL